MYTNICLNLSRPPVCFEQFNCWKLNLFQFPVYFGWKCSFKLFSISRAITFLLSCVPHIYEYVNCEIKDFTTWIDLFYFQHWFIKTRNMQSNKQFLGVNNCKLFYYYVNSPLFFHSNELLTWTIKCFKNVHESVTLQLN